MTELAKTFLAHPFAVLGASPRETLKELEERRREAVLFGDEKTAERAFEALIHPASRLAEELRWFPGMSREDTERWVRFAASGAPGDTAPAFQGSSFLARFQTIRICLDKLPLDSPFDWMTAAKSLLLASRWLRPGQVMEEINRDRRAAGFTAVNSVKTAEAELDALFQECAWKRSPLFRTSHTACKSRQPSRIRSRHLPSSGKNASRILRIQSCR